MAQFNLKALGKKIAELLGGSAAPGRDIPASAALPPSPQGPQIIGMPPPTQALPILTGPDPAELAGYQAQRRGALQTIGAPMPQPSGVDPIEAVLSMIAGGGVKDLGVLSRTAKIPGQLAAGRDAQALDQWKMGQDQAGVQLGDAQKMIGGWYDRESQNAKIEGMLKAAEMKGKVAEAVQRLKSDQAFTMELAKIPADQYTPARIYPLLESLHPDLDPEALQQMAQEMYQTTLANPSFKMKQDAAAGALKQSAQAQKTIDADWKIVNASDATVSDSRYSALFRLWKSGALDSDPHIANMDPTTVPDALRKWADAVSPKAGAVEAGTAATEAKTKTENEMRQPKIDALVASTGVSKKKAEQITKELGYMDEDHRAKIAKAWAAVDASKALAQQRRTGGGGSGAGAKGASPTAILQGIQSGINSYMKERAEAMKAWIKEKGNGEDADPMILKLQVDRIKGIDKELAALKVEQRAARGGQLGGSAPSRKRTDPKTGRTYEFIPGGG